MFSPLVKIGHFHPHPVATLLIHHVLRTSDGKWYSGACRHRSQNYFTLALPIKTPTHCSILQPSYTQSLSLVLVQHLSMSLKPASTRDLDALLYDNIGDVAIRGIGERHFRNIGRLRPPIWRWINIWWWKQTRPQIWCALLQNVKCWYLRGEEW